MRLIRGTRPRAEDVFLIGEELAEDDAEGAGAHGPDGAPGHAEAVGAVGPGEGRSEVRERSSRSGSPGRWLGVGACVVAVVVLTAVAVRGGGDDSRDVGPPSTQSVRDQIVAGPDRQPREASSQNRDAEKSRGPQPTARQDRSGRRRDRRDGGAQSRGSRAAGESAPAPVEPAPVEPVSAPATVTSEQTSAAPAPVAAPEPAASTSGDGGTAGSCGPYDIGC